MSNIVFGAREQIARNNNLARQEREFDELMKDGKWHLAPSIRVFLHLPVKLTKGEVIEHKPSEYALFAKHR